MSQPNQPSAPQGSQSAKPASPATPAKKTWQEMSKDERATFRTASLAKAVEAVKHGARSGILVKVGDHTLTLRPNGVSDKGSVAYGYKPAVIMYEGQRLRINRISFSILNDGDTNDTTVDWDNLAQAGQ